MAKTTAKSMSKSVVWVILLLLILGLGGYGAINVSGGLKSVGEVGDTPIPVNRYARQLNQDLRALQSRFGQSFTMQQAQQFGLDQNALSKVVSQVALENEAARIGISVGDAEVAKVITAMPDFKGLDGKFDPTLYRDTLKRVNETVPGFEAEIRAEGGRRLLSTAVAAGVAMPKVYADRLYDYAGERRSFTWAELSAADLDSPIAAPSDAQLDQWYKDHPDSYTIPQKKVITYAWITPSMLAPKVPVDEQALKDAYARNQSEYSKPETRLVERLVFQDQAAAQAAWDRLQSGAIDFEGLVAERNLSLQDIDLGDVTEDSLGQAGAAVFGLKEPGTVGPVETSLGPAIFRVNTILAAQETSYEDARPQILDDWSYGEAQKQINDMMEKVSDLLAGGATLEDLAKETDMELGTIDWSDDVSDGIAGYGAFRKAAADVTEGDYPDVAALDDGGLFAIRLDKVVPPTLQPLADVHDQVVADWTADATRAALEAKADALVPQLSAGANPAKLGLSANRVELVARTAPLADVPPDLVATAFSLAPGAAARIAGIPGTGTVAVVRTEAIAPPDPTDTRLLQQRDASAVALSRDLAGDVLDTFTRTIESTAGIHLDAAAVNAVNSSIQ